PGIARIAKTVDLPASDVEAIANWAAAQAIGLVVVGPEAPLALGLVDLLQARGVPAFGPTRAAAELEWSKVFAKAFMRRHGIPTASFAAFTHLDEALAYVRGREFPLVVKADGLAAGKGVVVCGSMPEAQTALYEMLVGHAFGRAG